MHVDKLKGKKFWQGFENVGRRQNKFGNLEVGTSLGWFVSLWKKIIENL